MFIESLFISNDFNVEKPIKSNFWSTWFDFIVEVLIFASEETTCHICTSKTHIIASIACNGIVKAQMWWQNLQTNRAVVCSFRTRCRWWPICFPKFLIFLMTSSSIFVFELAFSVSLALVLLYFQPNSFNSINQCIKINIVRIYQFLLSFGPIPMKIWWIL